jgi:hypothetical protein
MVFVDRSHAGGIAWDQLLYLIGATMFAMVFVYFSGGRGWEPVHGFYPMYGWLARGAIVNFILLSRPWRRSQTPTNSK